MLLIFQSSLIGRVACKVKLKLQLEKNVTCSENEVIVDNNIFIIPSRRLLSDPPTHLLSVPSFRPMQLIFEGSSFRNNG